MEPGSSPESSIEFQRQIADQDNRGEQDQQDYEKYVHRLPHTLLGVYSPLFRITRYHRGIETNPVVV